MARKRVRTVDRASAPKYAQVAEAFLVSADAVSIRHAQQKATDGDHEMAAAVLRDSVRNLLTSAAEKALRSVLAEKDSIAYQGRYYPLDQGIKVLEQAKKFARWAREAYEKGTRR